ncbi:hypothetical protein [Bradyrhizobium erythrophlei]|uniref:Uncharacterized protein n=1 Tax=Bradyrhizobium erythrophlei TaxID=1437360 RepID=A0A1H4Y1B7_9BRAD|nr:hypothetical protein [Bradyrhizobium erythrophlei]SED10878.1 hypothetical protein SAMN05444164_3718 [Bradyrhizobium erythrophlei]
MRRSNWTPSIVPSDDQTVYLVADDFGRIGRAWREADLETADLENVIQEMLAGEYSNPIRVAAFNTSEHWSEDVSGDIAREIQRRCDLQLTDVPPHLQAFVDRHISGRQLALRLV